MQSNSIFLSNSQHIPEGFALCQLDEFKKKRSIATTGEKNPMYGKKRGKLFNNGIRNAYFIPGTEPAGFQQGMLK